MDFKVPVGFKSRTANGFSNFQANTILFVDRVAGMIDFRLLAILCLIAAGSLVSAILLSQNPFQAEGFTPEQINYLGMPDTRVQTKFYSIFCVALFAISLVIGIASPGRFSGPVTGNWRLQERMPVRLQPYFAILFWIVVLLLYEPKLRDFLTALAAAYVMKQVLDGRFRTLGIFVTFFIISAIYFLLPLAVEPQISDGRLWTMDIHWSAVLGDGLSGIPTDLLKFEAFSAYGVLLSELVMHARVLPYFQSFGGTQSLMIVMDMVFMGLTFLIIVHRLGWRNRRIVWAAALLILLLFSGMISGVFQSLATPNLLPIRFILIPATIALAYYLGDQPTSFGSLVFGIVAPFLIFYNFETGVYCILAIGFAFFIKAAKGGVLTIALSGLLASLGFTVSGLVLIFIMFDGPVSTVFPELTEILKLKIQSGTSGYAGLSYYFFVPFLIVMTHSMALFSRHLITLKDGQTISPVDFQGIVIIGLIIAIGPYVMNRYHVLNMWIPFLLYILLVLPKLVSGEKLDRAIWSFVIIVLIAPFIFGNPIRYIFSKDLVSNISLRAEGRLPPCIDGIPASEKLCQYTSEKADQLKQLAAQNPGLMWLSGLSLTMSRLTGLHPAPLKKALFFYAHREESRNVVLEELAALNAPIIVFDNVEIDNAAGIPKAVEQFQANLLRDAGYEIVEKTAFWTIARKDSR